MLGQGACIRHFLSLPSISISTFICFLSGESLVVACCFPFFPRVVLDEIWGLIELVSDRLPTYSFMWNSDKKTGLYRLFSDVPHNVFVNQADGNFTVYILQSSHG